MQMRGAEARGVVVRRYRPEDRDAVRALCSNTGFLGNPIDPVFEDRELFADFLTNYYLNHEPDSAFIVTVDGETKGYLLGSRCPLKHQAFSFLHNLRLAAKLCLRYWRYRPESRRFVHWIILNAWREVPAAPRFIGHFHLNILPEARRVEICRQLLETYLAFLYESGVKQVYGQMVTFDGRRGFKLFERYGFKVLNRSEITKYKRFTDRTVYLCTVVKELDKQQDRLLYPVRD